MPSLAPTVVEGPIVPAAPASRYYFGGPIYSIQLPNGIYITNPEQFAAYDAALVNMPHSEPAAGQPFHENQAYLPTPELS